MNNVNNKITKVSIAVFIAVMMTNVLVVFGDLNFSSDFAGEPNWNWDTAVGDVSGMNEFVVNYGDPVASAYVNHDVDDPSAESDDGTGHLRVSFDIDVSNLSFSSFYTGSTVFNIDTPGNKGPFKAGSLVDIGVVNWKADPGVTGQYRFNVTTSQIYVNGTSVNTIAFYPSSEQLPWIYNITMDIVISKDGTDWPVVADLSVIGPHSGSMITRTARAEHTMNYSTYKGFLSIEDGYFLGGLSTGGVFAGSSLKFNNLSVEWIVPPPDGTFIIIR